MLKAPSASKDAPFAPQPVWQMRAAVLLHLLERRLPGVTSGSKGIDLGLAFVQNCDFVPASDVLLSGSHERIAMPRACCGAIAV